MSSLCVEQCSTITSGTLQKSIKQQIKKEFPYMAPEDLFQVTKKEFDSFTLNDQHFEFQHMPNRLGGYRWFFTCPRCKERVLKLFLPPKEALTHEHKYYCKQCHNLQNESVIRANNRLYKSVIFPLKKLQEIERKLEIGHLRPEKVKSLLDEYDRLEDQMRGSPEYRLYVFKKQRGMAT